MNCHEIKKNSSMYFPVLVTFLRLYLKPTHLIFSALKNSGNIFQNQVRTLCVDGRFI